MSGFRGIRWDLFRSFRFFGLCIRVLAPQERQCFLSPRVNRHRLWQRGDMSFLLRMGAVLWGILIGGCSATGTFHVTQDFTKDSDPPQILLMPIDIELSELSAAGVRSPKADWTQSAKQHVVAAIRTNMTERDTTILNYASPAEGSIEEQEHTQLTKLYAAVANAILMHKYVPEMALPTKKNKFDWTIGDNAGALRGKSDVEYALFIYMRDSYSSPSRVVTMAIGVLFGVFVPGGAQAGLAALVDLKTGNIIWFNRMVSATGDLRGPDPARAAVDQLLEGFPL